LCLLPGNSLPRPYDGSGSITGQSSEFWNFQVKLFSIMSYNVIPVGPKSKERLPNYTGGNLHR